MSDQNDITTQAIDLRSSMESAARKLASALDDLQALQVETRWVDVNKNSFDAKNARLVASTKIELDGDTDVIVPLRDENGTLVPDQALLELHNMSVTNAMEYRTMLLKMITDFVGQARIR